MVLAAPFSLETKPIAPILMLAPSAHLDVIRCLWIAFLVDGRTQSVTDPALSSWRPSNLGAASTRPCAPILLTSLLNVELPRSAENAFMLIDLMR
jgi:hypothetical protein